MLLTYIKFLPRAKYFSGGCELYVDNNRNISARIHTCFIHYTDFTDIYLLISLQYCSAIKKTKNG